MPTGPLARRAALALALSVSLVAVAAPPPPACPTSGQFSDPDACECPPGFGKILGGNGGGQCLPLTCGNGEGKDARLCSCEPGFEKRPKGKGKAICVMSKPAPLPKSKS